MLKSWPILYLGRLVYGIGSDSFIVGNSTLLSTWFKGKELAFAFAVNLAISRLGSVMGNLVLPQLANNVSLVFASWFAVILCGFGIATVLLVYPVDKHVEGFLIKKPKYSALSNKLLADADDDVDAESNSHHSQSHHSEQPIVVAAERSSSISLSVDENTDGPSDTNNPPINSFKDVFTLKHIFWVLIISCVVVYGCVIPFNNISSSLLLERDYFKEPDSACQIQNPMYCESSSNPYVHCPSSSDYQPPLPNNITDEYNPLHTSDIDCTDSYWKDNCATSLYCSRLSDAETKASFVMSIPFIISAALSPPTGFMVDRVGCRAIIATIAPAVLIIVHSFLALSDVSAVGPLVGQGLAYTAFVSVLWPSIPLVTESRLTGLAFGIAFSMQNLGCATIPLIIAAIYTDSGDHYVPNAEFLFIGLASVGVLVGLYMNYYDYFYQESLLNCYNQKKANEEQQQEEETNLEKTDLLVAVAQP
jgi:MFS family permease